MKRVYVIAAMLLFAGMSFAADDDKLWSLLGKFKAGADVKDVVVGKQISRVSFTCTEGTVTIKSIDVLSGGNVYTFHVGNALTAEKSQQVTVGNQLSCDSLRVTDDGTGSYEIRYRN